MARFHAAGRKTARPANTTPLRKDLDRREEAFDTSQRVFDALRASTTRGSSHVDAATELAGCTRYCAGALIDGFRLLDADGDDDGSAYEPGSCSPFDAEERFLESVLDHRIHTLEQDLESHAAELEEYLEQNGAPFPIDVFRADGSCPTSRKGRKVTGTRRVTIDIRTDRRDAVTNTLGSKLLASIAKSGSATALDVKPDPLPHRARRLRDGVISRSTKHA